MKMFVVLLLISVFASTPGFAHNDSPMAGDALFAQLFKTLMLPGLVFDADETLEFYWSATSGDVDHYSVVLVVNGVEHPERFDTALLPTKEFPYAVPYIAQVGDVHRIKVQAVDAEGNTGPMSALSSPVLRIPNTSVSRKPEAVTE